MKITFHLNYHTQWGKRIIVLGDQPELGDWLPAQGFRLEHTAGGNWTNTITVADDLKKLEYRYALVDDYGNILDAEWQNNRSIDLTLIKTEALDLYDQWRPRQHPENALDNTAFHNVIFKAKSYSTPALKRNADAPVLEFRLHAPRIGPDQCICMVGNNDALGNWDQNQPLLLGNKDYPVWTARIPAPSASPVEYKYGIYDTRKKEILFLEQGPNRKWRWEPASLKGWTILNDIFFQYPGGLWKGAGMAIPVFSLRTTDSFGVGSFSDIKTLVDWARKMGMKMVQILPINDTSATGTWKDSYPYAAISVFALHPLYLDLTKITGFKKAVDQKAYKESQKALNALPMVDYEAVMEQKLQLARQIYQQEKEAFLKDKEVKSFIKHQEHWLKAYALFCTLRDRKGNVDFNTWGEDAVFTEKRLKAATRSNSAEFDDIAFYYFLQYHLDRQLQEVARYAREHHVVLKGDIPIGIYRYSVDAWTQPHLYHMDSQSGAPPDPFSDLGQNWGFPTYNWSEMAKDGYSWWQNRLRILSRYFDAFRIDHILGFFRIWQIPYDQIEGTLGYFNPAIPVTRQEFQDRGIPFDHDRFCRPFITEGIIYGLFGDQGGTIIEQYLEPSAVPGQYQFKAAFDTQRKVGQQLKKANQEALKKALFQLHSNVLFIEDPKAAGEAFHPRIDMQKTTSYQHLDGHLQWQLNELYNNYFYQRQDEFWREQAMTKLPAIKAATDMLICGEDLGMIPACVPPVMRELDLLTLEIQRMSKNPQTEFLQAVDIPYFSVCSPSTHDMSPIRFWWEESEREYIRRFYWQELNFGGEPPMSCEPYISEKIILQHLQFPSMWAVFPIQDLLGMDGELRNPNPETERINVPANPEHYWRYRLHLPLEQLIQAEEFNAHVAELLEDTGRG